MCITKMIFIFPVALNPPLLRRWPFAAWRRIDRLQSSAGWRKNRAEMRWISTRIPSDAILLCSSVTLAQSVSDPTKRKKHQKRKWRKLFFWGGKKNLICHVTQLRANPQIGGSTGSAAWGRWYSYNGRTWINAIISWMETDKNVIWWRHCLSHVHLDAINGIGACKNQLRSHWQWEVTGLNWP